jgi:hypothetical protein
VNESRDASPLCVQVNPYGQEFRTQQPDDGRVRPACRQLLGKPALPLARIIVREYVCRTAVPAGQDSMPQLQSDSRVFREVANIVSLHPVLCDDPELVVDKPIAHRCAPRPARLATCSLKESAARHCQAGGKEQLIRNVEDILPQGMDNASLQLGIHRRFPLGASSLQVMSRLSMTLENQVPAKWFSDFAREVV